MGITVKYMAHLRTAVGSSTEQVDIATPCTVRQVLAHLLERHADSLRFLLSDGGGNFQGSILVCVGDEQVPVNDPTPVQEGQVVTLLAPISGG